MKLMLVVLTLAAAVLTACGQEVPVAQVQGPVVAVTTPSPTPAPTPACSTTLAHFVGQGSQVVTVYAPAHATVAWTTNSDKTPKRFSITGATYADAFGTWALEQQGKHSVTLPNPAGCFVLQWVTVSQGTAAKPEVYPAPSSWSFDIR